METINAGILTLSDRATSGAYNDRSGPAVQSYLEDHLANPLNILTRVLPDEEKLIRDTLIEFSDIMACNIICTTGGTGPAMRDVTPEATVEVCRITLPGFGEEMRRISLQEVPTALLSRQTAGLRGSCLIVNLPGNPKAISVCLDAVIKAVPGAVHISGGPEITLK